MGTFFSIGINYVTNYIYLINIYCIYNHFIDISSSQLLLKISWVLTPRHVECLYNMACLICLYAIARTRIYTKKMCISFESSISLDDYYIIRYRDQPASINRPRSLYYTFLVIYFSFAWNVIKCRSFHRDLYKKKNLQKHIIWCRT